MRTKSKPKVLISLFLIAIASAACQKERTNAFQATSQIIIRMTDAPANYTAVNIDIRAVEILYKDSSMINCKDSLHSEPGMDATKIFCDCDDTIGQKWIKLSTKAGIYDLLKLQNGIDTIIATGQIQPGRILQMRLILGDRNSVVVNNDIIPLKIPGGMETGLKLILNKTLSSDSYSSVLFDFNANSSIIFTGNRNYILNPVLRLKMNL